MLSEAVVSLTADEAMVLLDRIKGPDRGTEDHPVISYRLLEKLGSAFVDLVGDEGKSDAELPLVLSEAELWLCKDRVSVDDRRGTDALFGVRLVRKLMAALLQINSPALLPTVEHTDPDRETVRNAMLAFNVERERTSYDGLPQPKE